MPKEEPHLSAMRRSRKSKRDKVSDMVSSHAFFQVVGSGAPGGPRSLMLVTAHRRHLFNCSEGTQRVVTEQCPSKSIAQCSNVFITRRDWNCLGGFPGMTLSVRGAGAPDVAVHGPKGCVSLFEATKNFILLYEFDVIPFDLEDGDYTDPSVRVQKILLEYSGPPVVAQTPKHTPWDGLVTFGLAKDGKRHVFKEERDPSSQSRSSPIDQNALAYLVTVVGKKGTLDAAKCAQLGVPSGPLLGVLKSGKSVTLDDGTVVESADVTGEDSPPTRALVVDCLSEHYFPSLLGNDALNGSVAEDPNLAFVFHFSPVGVTEREEYKTWMARFNTGTVRHVFVNDANEGFTTCDVLRHHKKLHMIAPNHFSPLHGAPVPVRTGEESEGRGNVIYAGSATIADMKPERQIRTDRMSLFSAEAVEKEVFEEGKEFHVTRVLEEAHEKMCSDPSQPEYPKLTLLGTGSSVPSKYRNATCILVEHEPDSYFLLDCGEGSVGQLHRQFGREKALDVLTKVRAIFLSHHHADHHLGLIGLLQTRRAAFEAANRPADKVYIICPGRMATFYREYHYEFEPVLDDAYQVRSEHLLLNDVAGSDEKTQVLYPWVMKEMLEYVKLENIFTCRAFHCPHSFCIAFTTSAGYKIVFTGDTRPTEGLTKIGRHLRPPDLVIHEATMEKALQKEAEIKRHSTITEAIVSARGMGAKFTLLTHFSQRYAKVPTFDEIEGQPNVGLAFDFLHVSPRTLQGLSHMIEPLKIVFHEALLENEDKKEYYNRRDGELPRKRPATPPKDRRGESGGQSQDPAVKQKRKKELKSGAD